MAPVVSSLNVLAVFTGEVVEGMDVVKRIQLYAQEGDILRRPSATIVIDDCGVMP